MIYSIENAIEKLPENERLQAFRMETWDSSSLRALAIGLATAAIDLSIAVLILAMKA